MRTHGSTSIEKEKASSKKEKKNCKVMNQILLAPSGVQHFRLLQKQRQTCEQMKIVFKEKNFIQIF